MPTQQSVLKGLAALFNAQIDAPAVSTARPVGSAPERPENLRLRDHLRLRTLVRLRWLAILGQTAMVLLVAFGFGFSIRLWLCLGIVLASVWLNVTLSLDRRTNARLHDWEAVLQLSFDALQLALLLGATGGLSNPFCLMLIAPATVAAANLPTRYGIAVIGVSLMAAFALAFWSLNLPWRMGEVFALPEIYRFGFLGAIVIGMLFTAGYAWQAAQESGRMEQALAATQAVLEKEHRLSALGGLAAAAAHELGTPLGTIQVVAKEMLHALPRDNPLYEDAELLVSQSQRCRDILKALSARPDVGDAVYDQMSLRAFLEATASPYRNDRTRIVVTVMADGGEVSGEAIRIRRRPEWLHAFSAFVENAVDFARSQVNIRAEVSKTYVSVEISDDGAGFAPDILSRLGDPYISSRHGSDGVVPGADTHSGMGLGFFIAKTLCEYTGAMVTFGNKDSGGAYVKALWRRDQVDILLEDTLT